MSKLQNFLKGLIKENPVLVLVLGTCPTLAISTSVIAAFGMGIAATAVLILSNMAISAIRKIVPDPVRIPCYIVVIAALSRSWNWSWRRMPSACISPWACICR